MAGLEVDAVGFGDRRVGVAVFNLRRAGAEKRLADNDIVTSVGSRGDSYDNAMAESFNGLYITGDPLTKAFAKALEVVQQEIGQSGKVSATEVGDEESYHEVEVTLDDGSQVDVQLDETFNFVGFD